MCFFLLLSSCPGSMEYHIHHQQTILVLWACTHVLQHNVGIDICSKLGDDGHPALFVGSDLARASFKDLLEPLRRRVAKKSHHAAWQLSHETLRKFERSNPEIHGANSPQVTTVASWKAPPSWASVAICRSPCHLNRFAESEVTRQHWEVLLETYDHSMTDLLDALLEEAVDFCFTHLQCTFQTSVAFAHFYLAHMFRQMPPKTSHSASYGIRDVSLQVLQDIPTRIYRAIFQQCLSLADGERDPPEFVCFGRRFQDMIILSISNRNESWIYQQVARNIKNACACRIVRSLT